MDKLIQAMRDSKHVSKVDTGISSKVFIADAHRYAVAGRFTTADLGAFKADLLAAHKARTLDLGRCDMAQAFDRATVLASETRNGQAEYHFIIL